MNTLNSLALSVSSFVVTLCLLSACGISHNNVSQATTTNCQDTVVTSQTLESQMKFDKISHNFGRFSRKETPIMTHYYVFTNTGNAPLVIKQARVSCDCTTVEYPSNPIQPGEKDSVKVSFNGEGLPLESFRKSVTLYDNTPDGEHRLIIFGDMVE